MKALTHLPVTLVLLCAIGLPDVSRAGTATAAIGRVGMIQSIGDILFIQLSSGTVDGAPACSTNTQWQFAISLATNEGQQLMALLLQAKATDVSVQFAGKGACDVYSNVESLDAIYF